MWIPDSNGSTIEKMNSLQEIKEVMTWITTVGKGQVVFSRIFFVKLALPDTMSGEGFTNKGLKKTIRNLYKYLTVISESNVSVKKQVKTIIVMSLNWISIKVGEREKKIRGKII